MENEFKEPTAKIYKPAKSAMQSGKSKKNWVLEYIQNEPKFINSVTGWIGNAETDLQIKLKFDSKDEAVNYAERKKIDYILVEPNSSSVKIQSYADSLNS